MLRPLYGCNLSTANGIRGKKRLPNEFLYSILYRLVKMWWIRKLILRNLPGCSSLFDIIHYHIFWYCNPFIYWWTHLHTNTRDHKHFSFLESRKTLGHIMWCLLKWSKSYQDIYFSVGKMLPGQMMRGQIKPWYRFPFIWSQV